MVKVFGTNFYVKNFSEFCFLKDIYRFALDKMTRLSVSNTTSFRLQWYFLFVVHSTSPSEMFSLPIKKIGRSFVSNRHISKKFQFVSQLQTIGIL